jgi:hypothetical protein
MAGQSGNSAVFFARARVLRVEGGDTMFVGGLLGAWLRRSRSTAMAKVQHATAA